MNRQTIDKIFDSTAFKWLFLIFVIYLLFPTSLASDNFLCLQDSININSCLDQSWVTSINWALIKNFVFGKEYIFTYGALGFLSTRTYFGFSPYVFLVFDLFVLGNIAFILYYVFRQSFNLTTAALILLIAITISSNGMFYEQIVFILLLISLFWLNYTIRHYDLNGLIAPIIATTLLFYIKVNMSFVALVIFYFYLVYLLLAHREKRLIVTIYGLILPLLIFVLSFPLNTNLYGYILGSLALIDGYNDAMNSRPRQYVEYSNYAFGLLLIFFLMLFARWKSLKENWILFIAGGIFTFVLFKQSFVRADLHILAFFTVFPGLCGLTLIYYKQIARWQIGILAAICIICFAIGLKVDAYPNPSARLDYFAGILSGESDLRIKYEKNFDRFSLPPEVRALIGDQKVDIIPWNINYLYFNRLNYQPRPIIQSYSAYTPYLINLNGQSYENETTAPEFVLFSNPEIDGRYSFVDDMAVKLDLIKDYQCLGLYNQQNADFLLFQKRPGRASINFSPPVEEKIKFGEDYVLKNTDQAYFIKLKIKYTLAGKAVRLLFKPFQLSIYFTLTDGTTHWHRGIVPILENGVLINPYIQNERDFMNFAEFGLTSTETKKIKSFRIELDSVKPNVKAMGAKTYEQEIQLSVSEISIVKNN